MRFAEGGPTTIIPTSAPSVLNAAAGDTSSATSANRSKNRSKPAGATMTSNRAGSRPTFCHVLNRLFRDEEKRPGGQLVPALRAAHETCPRGRTRSHLRSRAGAALPFFRSGNAFDAANLPPVCSPMTSKISGPATRSLPLRDLLQAQGRRGRHSAHRQSVNLVCG